jgi:hypothetical protein
MSKKRIKYSEGQWFAVPLKDDGFAIGIIVRGDYSTKGGLGYFFGQRYLSLPSGEETYSKNKDNAIFICLFGDLGIITGKWPLISDGKPFIREEWPVPLFHRLDPLQESKAIIVEYNEDHIMGLPLRETITATNKILEFPNAGLYGSGAVEIELTKLLYY